LIAWIRSIQFRDPKAARAAKEWEQYFDEEIGVTLRLWFYCHILPDRPLTLGLLLQDAAWHERPLFLLVLRQAMTQFMNINGESAKQAEERLRVGLGKIGFGIRRTPLSCRRLFFASRLNCVCAAFNLLPARRH
jgi:glutathione S-transferase